MSDRTADEGRQAMGDAARARAGRADRTGDCADGAGDAGGVRTGVRHDERLSVPWWWWPLGVAVGVLLAAEIHLGYPGPRSWIPYAAVPPLVAVTLGRLGRLRVRVAGGELWVGRAHLPVRFVGRAEVLDAAARHAALGPRADPAAYLAVRPWVRGAVRVHLTDPDDPTPYWLVSTRHPDRLAALLDPAARRG